MVRRCPSRLPKTARSIRILCIYSNDVGFCSGAVWCNFVQQRTGEPKGLWVCFYWARMYDFGIYRDAPGSTFAMCVHTEVDIVHSQSEPDCYPNMDIWPGRHIHLGSVFAAILLSRYELWLHILWLIKTNCLSFSVYRTTICMGNTVYPLVLARKALVTGIVLARTMLMIMSEYTRTCTFTYMSH